MNPDRPQQWSPNGIKITYPSAPVSYYILEGNESVSGQCLKRCDYCFQKGNKISQEKGSLKFPKVKSKENI